MYIFYLCCIGLQKVADILNRPVVNNLPPPWVAQPLMKGAGARTLIRESLIFHFLILTPV